MRPAAANPSPEVRERAARIRLLVLDVDGVLTDGRIIYTDAGEEIKCFHVRDGLGIRLLQQAGVEVAVITGRQSPAVVHRLRNLHVQHLFQGVRDKVAVLRSLQQDVQVLPEATAVMGDDLVDLGMMRQAGLAVAVADAPLEVRQAAHWVTSLPGGQGAVRELAELLLQAHGCWPDILRRFSAS